MAAPRKYPPKDAAEVIHSMAALGYSLVGISKHFKVARSTVKRWLEEDESLDESFEQGRETERQALHSLIVQSAVAGKPANANAMFILKCRHGYREFDSPNTKVDVAVNTLPSVMIVRDSGTDEQWAAKVAEQQKKLLEDAAKDALRPPQNALPAPSEPQTYPPLPKAPQSASQGQQQGWAGQTVSTPPTWKPRA